MITSGIIREVAIDRGSFVGNAYKVELNIFQIPGDNDKKNYTYIANCSTISGIYNSYKVGDVVYVGFLNNNRSLPVILGKIYQGLQDESRSFANFNGLKVLNNAKLPKDTVIGDIDFSDKKYFFDNVNDVIRNKDLFVNSIQLKTNNEGAGKLFFNDEEGVPQIGISSNAVIELGVDAILKVYNDTEEILVRGQAVYITDNTAAVSPAAPATGSNYSQAEKVVGVVMEPIDVHSYGFVAKRGFVSGIVVDPGIYDVNDVLYLSSTIAGGFTNERPAPSSFITKIGYVTKLSSDSITADGQIYVDITIIPTLPTASTAVAGVIKIGTGLSITDGVLSVINPGFDSQTKKTFLAAPNAEDGAPTFREIIAADIPTLNQDTTGNAETATKLQTARTFTITDNDATNSQASATNFDGSENFTIKLPSTIKASLTGTATNVTGTVAIENGGTGQTTKANAFNALSPMTSVGDIIYGGTGGAGTRLAGNITTTRQFLISVGNGTQAVAPSWDTLTKTDVGLSNVDNTSDVNKPVSTATQTALNLKANSESPALTGTPTAPTATKGTNTTQIATTAFVQTAVGDYVPTTRKVNNKGLSSDITLSLDDVNDGSTRKLSDYVAKNTAITGATKTKITYDSKGLVTAGANATLDDIGDGSTRKLANYLPLTGGTLTDNLTIATDKYLIADHISNSGSLEISAQSGVDIIAGQNDGDIRLLGLTEIKPNSAGSLPLKVVGYSGLTANIAEFYNNTTLKLSINKDGQLVSPIATGTSPLSVTSTTVNTNLNADKLDGADLETTLSTTSDVKIPSSKAIATYIANKNYLDSSSSLGDLSDVYFDAPPAVGNLLRYNGEEWAPASASGTYAGPTETLLGSRTTTGSLEVSDIDNFDEIVIELWTKYTYSYDEVDNTWDIVSTRMILPKSKYDHYAGQNRDGTNYIGGMLTSCNNYRNDIISVQVSRNNAAGTSLDINFRGTLSGSVAGTIWQVGVTLYGRNW